MWCVLTLFFHTIVFGVCVCLCLARSASLLLDMKLHYGDLTDSTCLVKIINEVKPTEVYNLGAQSHVKVRKKKNSHNPFQLSLSEPLPFCCVAVETVSLEHGNPSWRYGTGYWG